jgi:prepilin-type N-terminal cleavage/methylation domain-containing protein
MNLNKKKKGFTIVELVIVIAVIGILAAVLIPTFGGLIMKANVASDSALVKNINTQLAIAEQEHGKNPTMYEALLDAKEAGYIVSNINARSNNQLVWDETIDRFALIDSEGNLVSGEIKATNNVNLWKISKSVDQTYSTYYTGAPTTINTSKGFDCGDVEGITAVNYTNNGTNQNVVIRTNSANTTLTIDDASTGTINHYGSAGELNIIQCHTDSYHENGKVAYAEIAKGHIVLEAGSKIDHIHVNRKNENTFDNVKITDNGAEALPTAITRDEVSVETAKELVVTVVAQGQTEEVYVYASGNYGTTEQTVSQNTDVDTNLGKLVLDNGSSGDKALTEEQKENNKEEVIEVAKDNEKADVSVKVTINDVSTLMSLAEFRNNVNNDVEGYKTANVELTCNINLGGVVWEPIKEFSGVFDGKGYTISNYTVNTPNDKTGTGLFKKLIGEENSEFSALSDVYNSSTHEFSESKMSENKYTCVVKNLKLSNVTTNANHGVSDSRFTAGLVGIAVNAYISNIEVSKSTINVNKYGSAVVGSMGGTVIKDVTIASDVTVIGTGSGAGHVAGVVGESGNSQGTRINAIVNATNNATITGYYGNNAGIGALAKGVFYYNCINNGTINLSNDNNACGGICGNGDASWFIMCTNNGNINAINHSGQIAGIFGYKQNSGVAVLYKCYNYGDINSVGENGTAKLAGISFDGTVANSYEDVANYGILTGPNASVIYDISNNNNLVLKITDSMSFTDLVELLNSNNASSVNITAVITGELGTLELPANTKVFSASSAVATKFDLSQLSGNSVTINMPGSFELVNINGKSVTISGNSNVTVGSSENGRKITLKGQQSSLTNYGSLENVLFGGSGSYTLCNHGIISHETEGEYGNEHTIDTINSCNITIHNHGTIEAKKNESDVASYALLFYNGATVNLYAYDGSKIISEKLGVIVTQNGTVCNVYYQDGAQVTSYGSETTYPKAFGYYCTVTIFN